jgi:hypothetical protein
VWLVPAGHVRTSRAAGRIVDPYGKIISLAMDERWWWLSYRLA